MILWSYTSRCLTWVGQKEAYLWLWFRIKSIIWKCCLADVSTTTIGRFERQVVWTKKISWLNLRRIMCKSTFVFGVVLKGLHIIDLAISQMQSLLLWQDGVSFVYISPRLEYPWRAKVYRTKSVCTNLLSVALQPGASMPDLLYPQLAFPPSTIDKTPTKYCHNHNMWKLPLVGVLLHHPFHIW